MIKNGEWNLEFLKGVSVGVFLGASIMFGIIDWLYIESKPLKIYQEVEAIIKNCEKSLPRDQNCVIVFETEVKKNE